MRSYLFESAIVSLAVMTAACGNGTAGSGSGRERLGSSPPAQDDRSPQDSRSGTPFTVTGCLQQEGRTFIVTELNEPAQKNAGSTGNGAAVEREQIEAAAHAYRISPAVGVDLNRLVGKQVRVSGTLYKPGDLPRATGSPTERQDIDKGDLAQVSANAVSEVAENCGGGGRAAGR